jgi:hypothetical protein
MERAKEGGMKAKATGLQGLGLGLAACLGLVAAGCGAPSSVQEEPTETEQESWAAAPHIDRVTTQRSGFLISGQAPPGSRVVLSSAVGAAMAAGADARGRFELPVGAEAVGYVLTPEIQIGQTPVPGAERLLLAGEGAVVGALLIDGGASRRLTEGPSLDAVDGDGRGLLLSGRSDPGRRIEVRSEGETVVAVADEAGFWVAPLSRVSDREAHIEVGDDRYIYPGPGPATGRAERAAQGWRVTRVLSGAARQTSWFPDATKAAPLTETSLTPH